MNRSSQYLRRDRRVPDVSRQRGFALVVTISLLLLLTVVAVGLLSLSAVTMRSASNGMARAQAQANARLALMLAIGELQKQTGPDTRITAPSSIVDPNSPPLTGVWKSWEGSDHDNQGRPTAPDYAAKKKSDTSNGRFLIWLVSGAEQGNAPTIQKNLVSKTPSSGTVPLLSSGTLGAGDDRQVHLVPQRVNTNANDTGNYAWWVSGENQKACLGQPYKPRTDDVAGLAEMGQSHTVTNPEAFGLSTLLNDPEPHNPNTAAAKPARKAVSRQTMALIEAGNATEPQKKFHDLTAYATGLLTNTATGGWRKDLSLLTEKWDSIYNGYSGGKLPLFRFSPTAGATSQVPKPTVASYDSAQSNLYPWSAYSIIIGTKMPGTYHAASASWQSLVSFATAYKNFSINSGVVQSPFVWDAIADPATTPTAQQFYNYKHTQRLHPQIARFQFVVYAKAIENPVGKNPKQYQLNLMYVPIFTLWNPYNVGLSYNIPSNPVTEALGFGWRRALPGVMAIVNKATYPSGPASVPNSQYQLFTAGNFQYLDAPGNDLAYGYDQNIPENVAKGYTVRRVDIRTFMASLPAGPLTFKPGETKVFSPDGRIETKFGGVGMGLEVGYNPGNIKGYSFGSGSYNETQSLWFLMKTDKLTKPYKGRNPGQGFSLSFGKTSGPTYTGGVLQSGVNTEFHNLTSLASDTQGSAYWPPAEVDEVPYSLPELASGPWLPVFSINFAPRMTIGTGPGTKQNRPTKGVLQNNPLASMVLSDPASGAAKDHPANGTFDITYNSLSIGSTLTPNLSTSKGFIATGYQSGDGLSRLIMCDIPLRPMASVGELQGWNPRGNNPYPPFQCNLIGNSDATPLIPKDQIVPPVLVPPTVQTNLQHDDAYCANHLLFDDWFVSSIAPQPKTFGGDIAKDINTVYQDYLKGNAELTNRAYRPIAADSKVTDAEATKRIGEMITSKDGWLKVASRFEVEGMFNVNSTSVEAWNALLGQAKSLDQMAMHGANEIVAKDTSHKHVVARGAVATDVEAGTGPGFGGQFANASEYAGFRSLSDAQIKDLAEKVVEQVRLRGPFLSLSEFVNRRISSNTSLALAGAIQSALNNLTNDPMAVVRNPANSLSDTTMPQSDPKLTGVGYEFPESSAGGSAYGAPGWIRQADILRPLAPILSARDDTFTIRAYGDSLDKNGKVMARAWCEAVVKRTREFSDMSDSPDSIDPPANQMNTTFGRRYGIVFFRWLSLNEV